MAHKNKQIKLQTICLKMSTMFQAFQEMSGYFNKFMKCLIELVILENFKK